MFNKLRIKYINPDLTNTDCILTTHPQNQPTHPHQILVRRQKRGGQGVQAGRPEARAQEAGALPRQQDRVAEGRTVHGCAARRRCGAEETEAPQQSVTKRDRLPGGARTTNQHSTRNHPIHHTAHRHTPVAVVRPATDATTTTAALDCSCSHNNNNNYHQSQREMCAVRRNHPLDTSPLVGGRPHLLLRQRRRLLHPFVVRAHALPPTPPHQHAHPPPHQHRHTTPQSLRNHHCGSVLRCNPPPAPASHDTPTPTVRITTLRCV